MPCRINRRRQKTGRLIAEALVHRDSTFVTLTYRDEALPAELNRRDPQDFMRSLRKLVAPRRIRYYIVGEYGDKTLRPHYHGMLYGISKEEHAVIAKAWGNGFVYCGDVTPESCSYVAGYVLKKITDTTIPEALKDKAPSFALMSLKPGIGAHACDQLANALMTRRGTAALALLGDVPGSMRIGGKEFPLDRYMKSKLREALGWEKTTPVLKKAQILAKKAMETAEDAATRHKRGKAAQFRASAAALHQRSKSVL